MRPSRGTPGSISITRCASEPNFLIVHTPRTPPEPAGGGLALDRPPTTPPAPSAPPEATALPERLRYRGIPLDGTPEQLHRAVDLLEADTVPYTYYLKVVASREPAQQPLGRRAPQALDAPREGIER